MNYQYHQWRKCHPSQKGEKCRRKWKEMKMRGKHCKEWKRHAWGDTKIKMSIFTLLQHAKWLYVQIAHRVSVGGWEVCAFFSTFMRAEIWETTVQLCSCQFHIISFPFNAAHKRPLMILFQDMNTEWIEYIWPYWSWRSIILLIWKPLILMEIIHTAHLSTSEFYHPAPAALSTIYHASGDLPLCRV